LIRRRVIAAPSWLVLEGLYINAKYRHIWDYYL